MASPSFLIYIAICLANGRKYVGQTRMTLAKRMVSHQCSAKHDYRNGCVFPKAIRKHGWHNFAFEILESGLNQQEADAREKFWIADFRSLIPNGYNVADGGSSNRTVSASEKQRMSALGRARLGFSHTEETKRKIGDANRGRKFPPEVVAAMRERMKKCSSFVTRPPSSKTLSEWGKKSPGGTGKKHTEAWKQATRERMTGSGNPFFGKRHSPEMMAQIKSSRGPVVYNDEQRRRMSEGTKLWWKKRKAKKCPL